MMVGLAFPEPLSLWTMVCELCVQHPLCSRKRADVGSPRITLQWQKKPLGVVVNLSQHDGPVSAALLLDVLM